MYQKLLRRLIPAIFAAILFVTIGSSPANAAYSIGFNTDTIQITSPYANNTECDRSFTIEGTSTLDNVWLCLRGGAGEITTYCVPVEDGKFSKEIWLRFGEGLYTVWAGDNGKQFNGKIRFEIWNKSAEDYINLTPSGFVNSDDPKVIEIAASLTDKNMSPMDKVKAIHSWVTKNITYDTNAYYTGNITLNSATDILKSKTGTCRDYSFVFASLARAAGLETRVVYGDAWSSRLQDYEKHAWNETFIGGNWIGIDTTWDAGYIKDKKFVIAGSTKYLNMDTENFGKTHKLTSVTNY